MKFQDRQLSKNLYFKLANGKYVAMIGKTASSSLAQAILVQQYSHKVPKFYGADPYGRPGWQNFAEKVTEPDNEVLVLLRDPIERFKSACAQLRLSDKVDETIERLEDPEDDLGKNFHFRKVETYDDHNQNVKTYKFPEDLEVFCADAGLDFPLPVVNEGALLNPPKPILSPSQEAKIRNIFKDDNNARQNIVVAGQIKTKKIKAPK